ncbi:MAG: hypothetical protein KBS67_01550 [Bacteroidales bacterium]|nr:hypothetical protein [Candidatus Cryptobacteroides equifaecalis]
MKLFHLTSELHDQTAVNTVSGEFIKGIESAIGSKFELCNDYDKYSTDDSVIYVRTGGTEGIFRKIFEKDGELTIPGEKPVRLLTSGKSNSLAASMEILSYLNMNGFSGKILHGNAECIAEGLRAMDRTDSGSIVRPFDHQGILDGKRYAVIGKPSDWLISSNVDYAKARQVLGCEIIDIPMDEMVSLIKVGGTAAPKELKALNSPKYGRPITEEHFNTAVNVYGAAKKLVEKYELDGLTIRCFDLLTSVGNTGCLALALLNSQGYVATCEGDVPAMLSMAVGRELYGQSGFQVNLSRVNGDKLLFAHCTVPLNMTESYCYDTHFESGIGVGIHGELPLIRAAHILKLSADLENYVHEPVSIVENRYEDNLCRTQIVVEQHSPLSDYMLTRPFGNHHVIFTR